MTEREREMLDKLEELQKKYDELLKRVEDLEYFRDNARVLLDISDVQDS